MFSSFYARIKGLCCPRSLQRLWCCPACRCPPAAMSKFKSDLGSKTGAQVAASPPKCCATPEPAAPETTPPGPPLPAVMHGTPHMGPMPAAVSTAVDGTERQKNAPVRPSIEERLPQDVLEAVLGFLDRDTLCAARLVSKTFCAAASANICSLTCRSTDPGISRQRFPRLGRVTVQHSGKEESLEQVAAGLRDLITTLKVCKCQGLESKILAQIAFMPRLRELKLDMSPEKMEGIASFLSQCANLEIVKLPGRECSLSLATTIASVTQLKELWMYRVCRPADRAGDPADRRLDNSWLQQATALSNLQKLHICTTSAALPLIANLASLTGLTWLCHDAQGSPYTIEPLTRLNKLRSLRIDDELSHDNVEIACSLGSGSLVQLHLSAADLEVSDDCGRFLARQTALARLSLWWDLCDLRHLRALRVELLRSLSLVGLSFVDAEGVSALRKATSLTKLQLSFAPEEVDGSWEDEGANEEWEEASEEDSDDEEWEGEDNEEEAEEDHDDKEWEGDDDEDEAEEDSDNEDREGEDDEGEEEGRMGLTENWLCTLRLSQAIGGLTRLRHLSLQLPSEHLHREDFLDSTLAVRPLTGLTWLEIDGGGLEDGDLRALLELTDLRVLELSRCCLTNAVVPELSVLTNLTKLRLLSSGVTCTAALTQVLNPLRNARGWPPLECEVGE